MGGEAVRKCVCERHGRFKKARISKSQMKAVLITSFDIKGIVHFEFNPQGQSAEAIT
jgi:hypothetical protein